MCTISKTRRNVAGLLAGLLLMPAAWAQSPGWEPKRSITFIVGFGPGGSADILARLVAEPASKLLGVPVVVENVTGAAGMVAMARLARAKPDGYTIGMGGTGTNAIAPSLYGERLNYRTPEDFTPITRLSDMANVFMVRGDSPIRNGADFIQWLKANPGATYGIAGIGTSNHLTAEMLAAQFSLKLTPVPYRSNPQATTDLIGGSIEFTVDNSTTAIPLHQGGRARAVAVSTLKRLPQLPDVPTLAESGAPGFSAVAWQGLFGPAGMPVEIVQRLQQVFDQALHDPAVKSKLEDSGVSVIGGSSESFARMIEQEIQKWTAVVRSADITVQ